MKESRFEINPKHPNSNIHGVIGKDGQAVCFTQKGNFCSGCCNALYIQEGQRIVKDAGEDCEARIPKKGCAHVLNNEKGKRFTVCPLYHCSSDRKKARSGDLAAWQRLLMENAAALKAGEISKAEAKENEVFRIGAQPETSLTEDDMIGIGTSEDRVDEIAQWLIDNNL